MMLSRLAQARERGLSVPAHHRLMRPWDLWFGDSMRLFLESTEFMCAQPTVWDAERAARGCGEERQGNAELVWRMNASGRSCGSGGRPAVRLRKLSGGGTTTGL